MRFITSIVGLATLACAAVVPRDGSLDVKLSSVGNTGVKATITNKDSTALRLLNIGTILDPDFVEKVEVSNEGGRVEFAGIRKRVATEDLPEDAFTTLQAGESIEVDIEVASVHDMTAGGAFKLSSVGAIPFAEEGSNQLVPGRVLTYNTEELELEVDGTEAARVAHAMDLFKRTNLDQASCSSSQLNSITQAFASCRNLATGAATAAQSGSATRFQEYFKTTSSTTRGDVAARLRAVATECSSLSSGATTYSCDDVYSGCRSGVLAYALPSRNFVVSCPAFFTLPVLTSGCHRQDQATTILHEFTHTPGVYSPGTDDLGYGYAAATALSGSQALRNADTYSLFANAVYVNC